MEIVVLVLILASLAMWTLCFSLGALMDWGTGQGFKIKENACIAAFAVALIIFAFIIVMWFML